MLRTFFGAPVPAALNANTTVDCKSIGLLGINQLYGSGALGIGACSFGIRIDPVFRVEKIMRIHHYGDRRERLQRGLDGTAILGMIHDLPIHSVVGWHRRALF